MRSGISVEPADFRKGIDGLCRLCRQALGADPFGGTVFVFRNRLGTGIKLLTYEMKEIEKKMGDYAADTQKLLRSIPGIGKVTAAALMAHVGDIRRFSSPEKLVAYIGLDCRVHESGTSIHGSQKTGFPST